MTKHRAIELTELQGRIAEASARQRSFWVWGHYYHIGYGPHWREDNPRRLLLIQLDSAECLEGKTHD